MEVQIAVLFGIIAGSVATYVLITGIKIKKNAPPKKGGNAGDAPLPKTPIK